MKYWSFNAVWLLFFIILFCGCASQMTVEARGRDWIGRPLSELKQEMKNPGSYASKIGWKETTYPLANGNFIYIEPVSADCSLHWEISHSGIIIGYQAKGVDCKQLGVSDDYNIIKAKIR